MKKCKSCQKEIDPKATKCPYCQADQRIWFRKHPILTAILILFVIGLIGAASGNGNKTTNRTASQPTATGGSQPLKEQPKEVVVQPTIVKATSLIAEFDKNKLAANDKYKGKLIQTTGYIKNISNDITGQYYLSLEPTNEQYYFGTTMACYFTDKSDLTTLANGQSVTVQGTMEEMTLGIVAMKDCKVVK